MSTWCCSPAQAKEGTLERCPHLIHAILHLMPNLAFKLISLMIITFLTEVDKLTRHSFFSALKREEL